ncbi:hypothetical protein NQ318_010184 [Aromia moschata]|uniref:Uncharacterized protein n=1 Tax=Aromia moschata TaxID=1265417 RepID=A0AAV8Y2N9_9CUCU|nr:hypothetical protein NQ318_010184 [Aromia moschata]
MRRQIRSNHIRIEGSERIRPAQSSPAARQSDKCTGSIQNITHNLVEEGYGCLLPQVKEDSAATLVSVSNVFLHFVL